LRRGSVNPSSRPSPSRLALLGHLADLIAARQQPHPIRVAIDGVLITSRLDH